MPQKSQHSLSRKQKKKLLSILPLDRIIFSPEKTAVYGVDSGHKRGAPGAVLLPRSADDIRAIMQFAQAECLPVHPRARGTNSVGACVPESGGLVVSCLDMNRVLEINERDYTVCVEPGAITGDMQAALAAKGLFYPPDPASAAFCTIGGNVSTNAGGMRAVKYGVTRDYVLGVEAVLPGGQCMTTGGSCHKDVVGLDLTSLFVGAEGALGMLTRIRLKLLPLPPYSATLLASFPSLDAALAGIGKILKGGILPVAMEVMPEKVIDCLRRIESLDLPPDTGAVLLLKLDGNKPGVKHDLQQAAECLGDARTRSAGPEAEDALWAPRRMVSQAAYSLGPNKISEDIAVPRGAVAEYVRTAEEIGREHDLPVLVFGHAGDGNMHTNIMYDEADGKQKLQAGLAREKILRRVLDMGGTMSGEHGIGQAKRDHLSWQLDPFQMQTMRRIKQVFDPLGIMNPVVRF
ncbi:MAG: FAD-binding oxidoreductase [Thermodesulfobacteriota bacterium]